MDSARVAAITFALCCFAFVVALAMFMWGRDSVADDCERYGKFFSGERPFECSPSNDTSEPR